MAIMTAERNYDGESFLSVDFRAAIRRRLRELGGLAVIVAVGTAAAALATWSINDPSLSHATRAPMRNLLGAPGAIAADLAMQLFGLATIAIIVPPAIWGWRLFTHRSLDRLRWRLAAWIAGLRARGGVCVVPAAHRPVAAADRHRRRGRRCAASRHRLRSRADPCTGSAAPSPR